MERDNSIGLASPHPLNRMLSMFNTMMEAGGVVSLMELDLIKNPTEIFMMDSLRMD